MSAVGLRALSGLILTGSIAALVNCTFVTARTNGQCFNDGECRSRGPSFANTRCSASGTCELVTLPEAGPGDAGGACTSNAECNALLSQKARCANGTCVPILDNANCTVADGDPSAPDAVYVGVLTPRTGSNSAFGLNQYNVVTAAAAEWGKNLDGQSGTHTYVTIGCDEIADPAGATAFLASKARVSAIFGPIYDNDFELAAPVATLSGTFMIGSRVDDPNLATVGGVGKTIWSTAPNRNVQAKYFQNLISTLEPSVKSMFTIAGDMTLAMVVATGDVSSTNFAAAVEPTLTFNGKTVAANQTAGHYARVETPVSFTTPNDYSGVVTSLVGAAPDLVVVTQENDLLTLVRAINTGWTGPKFPRFLFLTEDPAVDSEVGLINEKFAGKVDFVTWTRNATEKATATAFAVAYHTANGADPAAFSENLYDAFYENAYAFQTVLTANGNLVDQLDPGAYADAIKSLNAPGTLVSVGIGSGTPNNISTMLTLLASSGDGDLDGASGPLEFDATAGSPVQNAELDCIKASPGGVTSSGMTFSGSTGAALGTYTCL